MVTKIIGVASECFFVSSHSAKYYYFWIVFHCRIRTHSLKLRNKKKMERMIEWHQHAMKNHLKSQQGATGTLGAMTY